MENYIYIFAVVAIFSVVLAFCVGVFVGMAGQDTIEHAAWLRGYNSAKREEEEARE